MSRIAKGRLVRSVAILFLLYTGLAIACTQICSEEVVGLAANVVSLPESNSAVDSYNLTNGIDDKFRLILLDKMPAPCGEEESAVSRTSREILLQLDS